MHTATNREFAIINKPLLELLPNSFWKIELLKIFVSIKAKLSNVLYTLLSIEEKSVFNKLLIVSIIIWEILVVFVIVSSKIHLLNKD